MLHVSKRIQTTVLRSIADPGPNMQRYMYLFVLLAQDRDPYSQCRCWLGSGVQFTEFFLEKKSIKTYSNTPFPLILYFMSKKNKNINAAKITQKKQFHKFFCKCDPHDPNQDPDLYGNAGWSGSLYSIRHGFRSETLLLKAYVICNELEESAIKGNLTIGWKIDPHKEFIVNVE